MLITIEHDKLSALLEKAASVAATKSNAKFLQAIWISADEHGQLCVEATDGQLEYVGRCDCNPGAAGRIGASRHLYDLVRKLPAGEISLNTDDNGSLRVESGRRKYTMPVYDPSWYQPMSMPEGGMSDAPAGMIRDMLGHTSWAASQDPSDDAFHHVHIDLQNGGRSFRSWALDGHKLAMFTGREIAEEISLDELKTSGRAPVMKNHAQALLKLLPKDPTAEVSWAIQSGRIYVRAGGGLHCLSAPLPTQKPPDVDLLLEKAKAEYKMTIWTDPLLDALERIAVFTSDTQRCCRLYWTDDVCLKLSIDSADRGQAAEVVQMDGCTVKAEHMDGLTMPVSAWQAVIKQIKNDFEADVLEIMFSHRTGPVTHRPSGPSRDNMLVLLMPMTVTEDEGTYYE